MMQTQTRFLKIFKPALGSSLILVLSLSEAPTAQAGFKDCIRSLGGCFNSCSKNSPTEEDFSQIQKATKQVAAVTTIQVKSKPMTPYTAPVAVEQSIHRNDLFEPQGDDYVSVRMESHFGSNSPSVQSPAQSPRGNQNKLIEILNETTTGR